MNTITIDLLTETCLHSFQDQCLVHQKQIQSQEHLRSPQALLNVSKEKLNLDYTVIFMTVLTCYNYSATLS